jgi:polyhydroxyalkanoate synthase
MTGCSLKDVVWQSGKLTLHRYRPITRPEGDVPLLVVYALVNRPYMMDLQPDRSLIRGLLASGRDIYLIDWGYPDGADRFTTLDEYINEQLGGCIARILSTHRLRSLNLLGVCQGGVLSVCYSALHQDQVRNLITMVTPIDFHTPADLLSKWARDIDVASFVGEGNVSGEVLNQLFLALMPFRLRQHKYVELMSAGPDARRMQDFERVEKWIFDSPDQAGAAFREFIVWFYQENRLARNCLEIAGRKVDLRELRMPLLNLIAKRDHLVPPAASLALQDLAGSTDYTALEFDLGHIGMYISARAQREVPMAISQWLATR